MHALAPIARQYYTDELPYHNFAHIEMTLRNARTLIRRTQAARLPIDIELVTISLLFHDASYQVDSKFLGYPTKEHYSAHLADVVLRDQGYSRSFRNKVTGCILATRIFSRAVTLEQKIVRLADASAGMDGSFANFMRSNKALRWEWDHLYEPISTEQWRTQTNIVVSRYVRSKLTTARIKPALNAAFQKTVSYNLKQFLLMVD